MPIYEYECPECGTRFDRRVAMRSPDPECPSCGAQVRRLISLFATAGGSSPVPVGGGSTGQRCCGGACACGAR